MVDKDSLFVREVFVNKWNGNIKLKGNKSNYIKTSKYTFYSFVPCVIFEEFQKVSVFYFLIGLVINLFIDSPTSVFVIVTPLIILTTITLIARAYEDIKRYTSDCEINNQTTLVLRNEGFIESKFEKLKLGDIVKVTNNSSFGADMLLLYSSRDEINNCSITTANLDGETSLKTFNGTIAPIQENIYETFNNLQYKVKLTEPKVDLYQFHGHLCQNDKFSINLTEKNLLLRGTMLKNTDYVVGCVVYVGKDTKLSLNTNPKKRKQSVTDKRLNQFVLIFLLLQICVSIICSIEWNIIYLNEEWISTYWYVPSLSGNKSIHPWKRVESFFIYYVLFIRIVPISIIFTTYGLKAVASHYFSYDLEMYDDENDIRARANTIELIEELGQIEYLFTDKTGTLTENQMQFHSCAILCPDSSQVKIYTDSTLTNRTSQDNCYGNVGDLFLVLALCHTVQVSDLDYNPNTQFTSDVDIDKLCYQATSPDEEALLVALKRFGMVYLGSKLTRHFVLFNERGKNRVVKEFVIHETLEFDSSRKCMSVMVQDMADGSYWIFCKGAESKLFSITVAGSDANISALTHPVTEFAESGLRILVAGRRTMPLEEITELRNRMQDLRNDPSTRQQQWDSLYEDVEKGMTLMGVTAVLDRLQEAVPETLRAIQEANIKTWVITGDKEETAVNVSFSTGHFSRTTVLHRITKLSVKSTDEVEALINFQNVLTAMEEERTLNHAAQGLVIDGDSFQLVIQYMKSPLLAVFLQVVQLANAVVCCRMTPLQKAQVVRIVKDNVKPAPTVAAIGDGGNDVSMIMEASVGLAVVGREGRQAVRAADYVLPKFCDLRRAILYHGQCFYERLSSYILFFFSNSIMFVTPLFLYLFVSASSALTVYDEVAVSLFNITFSTPSIFLFGILDQERSQASYMHQPGLYVQRARNKRLTFPRFVLATMQGVIQAVIIFMTTYALFSAGFIGPGSSGGSDYRMFGLVMIYSVWGTIIAKAFLKSHNITRVMVVLVALSVFGTLVIQMVTFSLLQDWQHNLVFSVLSRPACYFVIAFNCINCAAIELLLRIWNDGLLYSTSASVYRSMQADEIEPDIIRDSNNHKYY